ncbi:hypothetical protein GQ473_02530 [archaeon]|nr:hypothetical protein [archaeon]
MDIVSAIKQRLEDDWDIVIACDGEEGSGKTTFFLNLFMNISDDFDFEKNICYVPSYQNIPQQFGALKPKSCYLIDEGTDAFYNLDFYDNVQKDIVKMYKRERKQNKVTGIAIPEFAELTKGMKSRVKLWVHLWGRGIATVFVKSPNAFSIDKWNVKENNKAFERYFKNRNLADITYKELLNFGKTLPNAMMTMRFKELPKPLYTKYKKLAIKYNKLAEEKLSSKLSIEEITKEIVDNNGYEIRQDKDTDTDYVFVDVYYVMGKYNTSERTARQIKSLIEHDFDINTMNLMCHATHK